LQHSAIVDQKLFHTGLLLAIGITIHNLPEGIAIGAGYMHTPKFGVFIAIAIMLHNIPEGIATALPLCSSGVCGWDAFRAALFSGLAEPVGAIGALLFLNTFQSLVPISLAFAGGVMMFITLDELIPTAREHGHQHYTAVGIILGSIFVFILSGLFGV
jgi:ZIP family zinc transporter